MIARRAKKVSTRTRNTTAWMMLRKAKNEEGSSDSKHYSMNNAEEGHGMEKEEGNRYSDLEHHSMTQAQDESQSMSGGKDDDRGKNMKSGQKSEPGFTAHADDPTSAALEEETTKCKLGQPAEGRIVIFSRELD
ncbi:hypothetical protein BT96DRAFT_991178 [Gymnopus androsaceus JB14]|uniref:Uncharacterized protein n=1 Tax=Gymnopus androsaceus JB14 TaxID=1447944 RepID=A0A6A4HT63_9AGAR|nr:hypothetical protein BT96DRAFT_991178 [Gymnopus androsaceus JB14]